MSLIWIALSMAGLMYQAAESTTYEIKARPFSTAMLPCQFTFIKGADQLQFSWQRMDIKEEIPINVKPTYNWLKQVKKKLPKPRKPKILLSYRNNEEVPEGESYEYKGRIKLDHSAFGNGALTLLLENVTFEDEGVYTCSARSPHGMGGRVVTLFVEDEEAPQVQLQSEEGELVPTCISTGWYKNPVVTWSNGTNDLTYKATMVKFMEARPDGTQRVLSVLHYPVKVIGNYHCLIREAEKVKRPRDLIGKFGAVFTRLSTLVLVDPLFILALVIWWRGKQGRPASITFGLST